MSDALKNKMYNYEVTPPENAWQNITLTLDELSQQQNISDTLKNFEVNPPAASWENITTALDEEIQDEKIRTEFLNLEAEPPSFAWNRIAEQLDEQSSQAFATRMYEYEVTPAAANWQKIASSLDAEQAPVIPISKNYNKIIRIAAAAAVMTFLAWAGYNLLNKNAENNLANNDTTINVPVTKPVVKTTEQPVTIKGNNPVEENNNNDVVSVEPIKKTVTKNQKDQDIYIQDDQNDVADSHTNSDVIATADTKNLHKKNPITTAASSGDNNTQARYLVYLTDQGDMKKLSKKLVDFTCIYTKEGDVSQQALAKLDEGQCNDQIKYWQERIANSSLQSSSNPLELIEILK